MSLEIFNGLSTQQDTFNLIKEKTGIEMTYNASEDSYGFSQVSMRFPDMEEARVVDIMYMSTASYLIFVDAENHFFACVNPSGDTGTYLKNWLINLIIDYEGNLYNLTNIFSEDSYADLYINGSTRGYYMSNNILDNQLTLVPARVYCCNTHAEPTNIKTFVKNLYVNYERKFTSGLKFRDQNGNKFVTLIDNLLYKID